MAAGVPVAQPTFTVWKALQEWGVINVSTLYDGQLQVQRMATNMFDNDYETMIDKMYSELYDDLKEYSALSVANGRIRVPPNGKKNIRGLIKWQRWGM